MSEQEEDQYIKEVSDWTLNRERTHKIKRDFKFKNFKKAMMFVNKVADVAEQEGRHPDICIHYNKVNLELYTYAISGLHENDFILAAKINQQE
jgi:4a-hydroxytetrahydrobiopterin dehydratase